jgi:prepilin-type processing-associated H-X9-DG protein
MDRQHRQTAGRGGVSVGGFSVIELLVMIVVLALLTVLLFPSLAPIQSASRQISCAIQLKSVSDGLSRHAEDFNDRYAIAGGLVAWEHIDPKTRKPSWMQQVTSYVSSKDVFSGCAAYPVASEFHYFLGARAAFIDAGGQYAAVQREKMQFPSALVVAGDNNFSPFENNTGTTQDADKDDYTFTTQVFSQDDTHWAPQHDGLLNTAFADGHIAVFDRFDPKRMTYRYNSMSAY